VSYDVLRAVPALVPRNPAAGALDRAMIAKVFHVLKWTPIELDRTISALLQERVIREVRVTGLEHPQLLSSHILKQVS